MAEAFLTENLPEAVFGAPKVSNENHTKRILPPLFVESFKK